EPAQAVAILVALPPAGRPHPGLYGAGDALALGARLARPGNRHHAVGLSRHPLLDPRGPVDAIQPPGPAAARLGGAPDLQPARSRRLETGRGGGRRGGSTPLRGPDGSGYVHQLREETVPAPRHTLSSPGVQPDRRRPAGRTADGARAGDRGPGAALPPGPRRRSGHALALAYGRAGRRLYLQGQRPVLLPAALPE